MKKFTRTYKKLKIQASLVQKPELGARRTRDDFLTTNWSPFTDAGGIVCAVVSFAVSLFCRSPGGEVGGLSRLSSARFSLSFA